MEPRNYEKHGRCENRLDVFGYEETYKALEASVVAVILSQATGR